jgi:predicted transposase YdaD
MVKPADIGGKRLISLEPNSWVKWVTQSADVTSLEILDPEFQWISRQNDALIKAYSPADGEFLIPNELQLRYTNKMPRRMRAYTALAEEKYNLPAYPVLVNILPPSSTITVSDRFDSTFRGLQARQDFKVINIWEIDAEMVFERSLSALLPLVPVMNGGDDLKLVQRACNLLRQDPNLSELDQLLAFFAKFVFSTEAILDILRWDMTVLRESPWYQEIQHEGELLGRTDEARSLVLRQLNRRIGEVSQNQTAQIQDLPLLQLEALGEALLDFSNPSDLANWLQNNGRAEES